MIALGYVQVSTENQNGADRVQDRQAVYEGHYKYSGNRCHWEASTHHLMALMQKYISSFFI